MFFLFFGNSPLFKVVVLDLDALLEDVVSSPRLLECLSPLSRWAAANGASLFTSASAQLGEEQARLGEPFRHVSISFLEPPAVDMATPMATPMASPGESSSSSFESPPQVQREFRLRHALHEAMASSPLKSAHPPTCLVVTSFRDENAIARLVMAGAKVGIK